MGPPSAAYFTLRGSGPSNGLRLPDHKIDDPLEDVAVLGGTYVIG